MKEKKSPSTTAFRFRQCVLCGVNNKEREAKREGRTSSTINVCLFSGGGGGVAAPITLA